jgi:hypothetical protein
VKPGRVARQYGAKLGKALEEDPFLLAPLKLHNCAGCCSMTTPGSCTRASSMPISTSITEDAAALFKKSGVDTLFENLDGFLEDGFQHAIRRRREPGALLEEPGHRRSEDAMSLDTDPALERKISRAAYSAHDRRPMRRVLAAAD